MHTQKMRKLNNILCNLSAEEHKTLMEKLQKDELGEYKINQIFFFEFSVIMHLRISANMFQTINFTYVECFAGPDINKIECHHKKKKKVWQMQMMMNWSLYHLKWC